MKVKDTRSVLVVESNPDISGLLKIELEEKGVAVTLTHDVETALESMKHSSPDLLLIHVDVAQNHSVSPTRRLAGPTTLVVLPRIPLGDFDKLTSYLTSHPELANVRIMMMTEERPEYVPSEMRKAATKIVRLFADSCYRIADEIKYTLDGPGQVFAGSS